MLGSSPLARGTRSGAIAGHPQGRLIPARAGNTHVEVIRPSVSAAHPRSRGEHIQLCLSLFTITGSSPLARGTRNTVLGNHHFLRLIPARAGNTFVACNWWCELPAHPRSRGEHARHGNYRDELFGSSPLTRGALIHQCHDGPLLRLIPAHAGSTHHACVVFGARTAHPRSRGEHFGSRGVAETQAGSSPLTRGARRVENHALPEGRLIPAHAGSTPGLSAPGGPSQAHPRSRGEHTRTNA